MCLWLVLPIFLQAQNPVSRLYNNSNGLPSNTVYYLLQDSKGYVWLGHDKGLSRFDGNRFVHYSAKAQQGKSISNLMEINNSIWCQDFSGNFYFTQKNILNQLPAFKATGAFTPAGVLNNTTLSLISYDSLKSYNTQAKNKEAYKAELVQQAVFHTDSVSYFLRDKAVCSFNGRQIKTIFSVQKGMPTSQFLVKTKAGFFAFARSGSQQLYKLDKEEVKPLPALKPGLVIQEVSIIKNEIWISTTTGAYCFDEYMQPLYEGRCFFADNSITKIIKDREGNYWFGTLGKGVLFVPNIQVALFQYGKESITALTKYEAPGQILAGTSAGSVFSFNGKNAVPLLANETKSEVFSLFYDKPEKTIIACSNSISFFNSRQEKKIVPLAGKVFETINNSTYVAAFAGGIVLLPRGTAKLQPPQWLLPYIDNTAAHNFLTQGYRGRYVLYDSTTHTLYTATAEGLKYYNPSGAGFITFEGKPVFASSMCMRNGVLYAGTFSDGVVKVTDNKALPLLPDSKKSILAVYKMYTVENDVWIMGDERVLRYNVLSNTTTSYAASNGLPKAELKDILVQDNTVYLATTDGLVTFSTNLTAHNETPPLISINRFVVNDREIDINTYNSFSSSENNIDIDLSLLSFKDKDHSIVSYSINNGEWKSLLPGIRNLQLAALASGTYKIEISATNEDGVKALQPVELRFSIAAPFYKKLWFIISIAALIIGSMYAYFRQRLGHEKRNNELLAQKMLLEQELHQSMMSSIKSQMNPHFLFNALNTVQAYIYTNEKENASLYLGKFSELTRMILNMSNRETISLAEEIKALKLYVELEQLRFEDKLTYSFTIDKNISLETIPIPSMLIQPYVENAIKHGLMHQKKTWELGINFTLTNNTVEVAIDDNGVGRKASSAINQQRNRGHQSFATSANKKRLDILNSGRTQAIGCQIIDKTDSHGQACGTTIILIIPIS